MHDKTTAWMTGQARLEPSLHSGVHQAGTAGYIINDYIITY